MEHPRKNLASLKNDQQSSTLGSARVHQKTMAVISTTVGSGSRRAGIEADAWLHFQPRSENHAEINTVIRDAFVQLLQSSRY